MTAPRAARATAASQRPWTSPQRRLLSAAVLGFADPCRGFAHLTRTALAQTQRSCNCSLATELTSSVHRRLAVLVLLKHAGANALPAYLLMRLLPAALPRCAVNCCRSTSELGFAESVPSFCSVCRLHLTQGRALLWVADQPVSR